MATIPHAITLTGVPLTSAPLTSEVSMAPVTDGAETAVETTLFHDPVTHAAVWQCEPGTYPRHKIGQSSLQFIMSGSATIVDDDGTEHPVTGGTILITPDGWKGTWHITETIRKFYVHTFAPAASS